MPVEWVPTPKTCRIGWWENGKRRLKWPTLFEFFFVHTYEMFAPSQRNMQAKEDFMQRMTFWGVALVFSVAVWGCSSEKPSGLPEEAPPGIPAPSDVPPEENPEEEEPEEEEPPPLVEPLEGWVYGMLMNASTGEPIYAIANISVGSATFSSEESGLFFLKLPAGLEHLLVIDAPEENFPRTSHRVKAHADVATFVEIWLLPFGARKTFDAAAGGDVATWNGARVVFPPGALKATGHVTARLAWLDASNANQLAAFPGGFQTNTGELLESFSAIAIEVRDGSGSLLNLNEGYFATATIPARGNVPGDVVPLWVYDEEAGLWKEEGELTGCLSGFCKADLPHLSWWNIDIPMEVDCVVACVADSNGNPVVGITVVTRGIDYNATFSGPTGSDGCICMPVRANSTAEVSVPSWEGAVTSQTITTNPTGSRQLICDSRCQQVSVEDPPFMFQAILSWGATPSDLDAHLAGPGPFHVFYGNKGSLIRAPFAALNKDVRFGYGPEVVTISECAEGTYEYSVLNATTPTEGLRNSQAKVLIALPDGSLLNYSVDTFANPQNLPHWIVGEWHCSSNDCRQCTWTPIHRFESYDGPVKAALFHGLTVCIADWEGYPAPPGLMLSVDGVDYSGSDIAVTGPDGCAHLLMRANSMATVSVHSWNGLNGQTVTCDYLGCTNVVLVIPPPGFRATLQWSGPSWRTDLDAHLTGPCPSADFWCCPYPEPNPFCSTGSFRVFHGNPGSLMFPPHAYLHEDVRYSYGLETISLDTGPFLCTEGTFRYSVLNAATTEGLQGSGAEVFISFAGGGNYRYSVDAFDNPQNLPHWIVGEWHCSETTCQCTWTPLHRFESYDGPMKN